MSEYEKARPSDKYELAQVERPYLGDSTHKEKSKDVARLESGRTPADLGSLASFQMYDAS